MCLISEKNTYSMKHVQFVYGSMDLFSFTTTVLSPGETTKGKDEDKSKILTGKKLENHLKKEAAKAQKAEQAAQRKAAAEMKKKAKEISKKTLQVATKICGPLTQQWTTMHDLVSKAKELGLTDSGDGKTLLEELEVMDAMRKDCSTALGNYTKNPNCDLEALSFTLEQGNQKIKDWQALAKNVRKEIAEKKKANAAATAAAKAAAAGGS